MTLSVDPRKIVRIWLIPWEREQGVYGVAYETTDGLEESEPVGTKAQAMAIVEKITAERRAAFDAVAKRHRV